MKLDSSPLVIVLSQLKFAPILSIGKKIEQIQEAFKEQVFSLVGSITEPAKGDDAPSKQTLIATQADSSEFDNQPQVKVSGMNDVGRNDPCPCGAINPATGEVYKWKKCGMINAPQHRKALIN